MKRGLYIVGIFLALAIAGVAIWLVLAKNVNRVGSPASVSAPLSDSKFQSKNQPMLDLESGSFPVHDGPPPPAWFQQLSELERNKVRVKLPAPQDLPWKSAYHDSQSCFEAANKEAVLEVLPKWIRGSLVFGEPPAELAPRYLWTLIQFTSDEDLQIAQKAVFSLYDLGDYDNIALDKMKQWIESNTSLATYDYSFGEGRHLDIRAKVLDELDLYGDKRLDETIYNAWLKNSKTGENDLVAVDYAYYLERHGHELPVDYWLGRVKNSSGLENAITILEAKSPLGLAERLQPLFEELSDFPAENYNSIAAALSASALLRLTNNEAYRNYLIQQAEPQIAAGRPRQNLVEVFAGLAQDSGPTSVEVLSKALQNGNSVIVERAIQGLGRSSSSAATMLLYESALKVMAEQNRVPMREMRALLDQGTPMGNEQYTKLQQTLLSGETGQQAVVTDFQNLEFYRKYLRARSDLEKP